MWLQNTTTGALKKFKDPKEIPGGYAILSHVWGDESEEDTFEKVRVLRSSSIHDDDAD